MRERARAGIGLVCLSLLCALLAPGCCDVGTSEEAARSFETTLVTRTAQGDESAEFGAREAITWVLTVRNTTREVQVLSLPTSQTHDLALVDENGRELWRWSAGRMFAQMLTELVFAAGETKRFEIHWDQRLGEGRWIPPGRYRASGGVPAGVPGTTSRPTEVTIR